jgi:hypothetical protein
MDRWLERQFDSLLAGQSGPRSLEGPGGAYESSGARPPVAGGRGAHADAELVEIAQQVLGEAMHQPTPRWTW